MFDIVIHISASIPIIGDESIVLVSPPNGFLFKKVEQEITANPAITFEEIKTALISNLKGIVTTKNAQNIW